jgi:AbrB family looped-hinge helix DNA binding protein
MSTDPKLVDVLILGPKGRLVLPAAVRRRLHVEPGDRLIVRMEEDGQVVLESFRERVRCLKGLLADRHRERDLAAELIEERRQEAARD